MEEKIYIRFNLEIENFLRTLRQRITDCNKSYVVVSHTPTHTFGRSVVQIQDNINQGRIQGQGRPYFGKKKSMVYFVQNLTTKRKFVSSFAKSLKFEQLSPCPS